MEWLVILAVFLIPVGVATVFQLVERSTRSLMRLLLSTIPFLLAVRLAYVVLFSRDPDPSSGEIALPVILILGTYIYMWVSAYQKDPKTTMDVTAAASYTVLGIAAARKYQKFRDQERAIALRDQLEKLGPEA